MHARAMPPPILLIAREPLVAGREETYREIEEEIARLSAELGCPHPYLAMESLTGPKEIWWFNGFSSPDEQRQVGEAYEQNAQFFAALKTNSERKAQVTGELTETVAHFRPELSSGDPWILGFGRFLVIVVTKDEPFSAGTVFQGEDGPFFVFSPAHTRQQADRIAASRPGSTVVVVRPSFSFPAQDWVAADAQFWQANSR